MTQNPESKKVVPDLLQSIDPRGIADPSLRQTIEVLLNLIEEQNLVRFVA
jgi:DNA-directed RNA polymerase specialized sigma54-like protein